MISYFESLNSYLQSLISYFESLISYFESLNSYFQRFFRRHPKVWNGRSCKEDEGRKICGVVVKEGSKVEIIWMYIKRDEGELVIHYGMKKSEGGRHCREGERSKAEIIWRHNHK